MLIDNNRRAGHVSFSSFNHLPSTLKSPPLACARWEPSRYVAVTYEHPGGQLGGGVLHPVVIGQFYHGVHVPNVSADQVLQSRLIPAFQGCL